MTRVLTGLALLLLSSCPAAAEERCYVTDPTGTPLNVRDSPNGRIIGTLPDGKFVSVIKKAKAANGKPWALVAELDTKERIGWVFYLYLSCS
ncbi:MAG TPA: SH3 domain-containing protein [Methyloceanibacter sp.]|nr:SH3 domain-containing protein [Methyloceanibacter sp.]